MQKFGIDLSRWQGDFNISKAINKHNVEFTILKIGGADAGKYKDKKFENYYSQCEKLNLPKGCYYYGNALTLEDAEKEAQHWLQLMEGKKFDYPVFYDVEGNMLKSSKSMLTDIIKRVCSIIENHGYWCGVYSSSSTFNTRVFDGELKRYSHWVASWTKEKPVLKSGSVVQIWQFGGEVNLINAEKINGITVDQNFCYIDYPTSIKKKSLNGYKNVKEKTLEEVAKEVIQGIWGNGSERKTKLTAIGYNYKEVQKIVNELLRKEK